MKESGKPLSELKRCLKKYPQAQRNLRVKRKRPLEELPAVMKLVDETEQQLSGKGRVLLRYSGTEPKIRLLIEGREPDEIDRQANRIAEAIEEGIGAGSEMTNQLINAPSFRTQGGTSLKLLDHARNLVESDLLLRDPSRRSE